MHENRILRSCAATDDSHYCELGQRSVKQFKLKQMLVFYSREVVGRE